MARHNLDLPHEAVIGATGVIEQEMTLREPVERRELAARGAWGASGVVIGTVVGFAGSGEPLVAFAHCANEPSRCRTTVPIDETALRRQVAVMFEQGDPALPLVMGLVHETGRRDATRHESERQPGQRSAEVVADGDRLVLTADREITLRCGKASITLTRSGKVVIRGTYVSSRSTGVQRINGASVQIN